VANVIKGPKLKKSYVDYSFLSDYIVAFNNAYIYILMNYLPVK